jgi:ADP-ribose pyrophosphatase YjhB (NUDIX family)
MSCTPSHYRFCPCCGGLLTQKVRYGHQRLVCRECRQILYVNPAVGVAVLVRRREEILWGRRKSGRFAGHWCIPCGYVEWGEEVRAAAVREFQEETGLIVELGPVLSVHSNFHDSERLTVGLWFAGQVVGGTLKPGDDLDQVGFYPLSSPPAPLAFPTDELVLAELRGGSAKLIPDSKGK